MTANDKNDLENKNIFNQNFICNNTNAILSLYKKQNDINSISFDSMNLKYRGSKFMHPILLNYNYCLFCYEKKKSKYYSINLKETHIKKSLKDFLKEKTRINLRLRKLLNKTEKLAKRRIIHSHEYKTNIKIPKKVKIQNENDSDTDLYIKKKLINKKNNNNLIKKTKANIPKLNNLKCTPQINISSESIKSMEKEIELLEFHDQTDSNLTDMTPKFENELEIKIKKNSQKNSLKTNNLRKNNRPKTKTTKVDSRIPLKNLIPKKKIESKDKSIESLIIQDDKNTVQKKQSSENYLSEIKKAFRILNINELYPSQKKKNALNFKKRFSIAGSDLPQRRSSVLTTNKNAFYYLNNLHKFNNENCVLCLEKIYEKFTLLCGDFFCRQCIRGFILDCLNDFSKFDKMRCPTCKEPIEKTTIEKLLTPDELKKYEKLELKIKGLTHKDLIPCPYPDCEGFAENKVKTLILKCQFNHIFCTKCLHIINEMFLTDKKMKHICTYDIEEEETFKYLNENKLIRKCPNCKTWVQKAPGGCNNMRCTNIWCHYEFCWICGKAYDSNHYKNPLSTCFGLSVADSENKFTKNKNVRILRLMFIILFIIFIILPIILVLFSVFETSLYVITFVLDGSAMKYIKLHSKFAHQIFYKFAVLFYFTIAIGLIPVGYISICGLIIITPIILIRNKIMKKKLEDIY